MHSTQQMIFIITQVLSEILHQIFVFQTADKLIRTFAEQIFYTGFIHADPHPGNGGYTGLHVCMHVLHMKENIIISI